MKLILTNELQWLKEFGPIDLTEEGISILYNELQWLKELGPIDLTEDGIINSSNDEHPLKTFNEEHAWNVYFPIFLTEEGIINSFNDLHSLKFTRGKYIKHCLICKEFL